MLPWSAQFAFIPFRFILFNMTMMSVTWTISGTNATNWMCVRNDSNGAWALRVYFPCIFRHAVVKYTIQTLFNDVLNWDWKLRYGMTSSFTSVFPQKELPIYRSFGIVKTKKKAVWNLEIKTAWIGDKIEFTTNQSIKIIIKWKTKCHEWQREI